MTRSVSTQTKIQQLQGLRGTKDVTSWENGFIENLATFLPPGGQVEAMSEKQVEIMDRLWGKHFA